MAFVKLDCGMLDSTLWVDRLAREIFVTALLMAKPLLLEQSAAGIRVRTLEASGFEVPPGRYGFVEAAGSGIVRRSGMELEEGLNALERLCDPDSESRTPDFEGRRMVRISGGYILLNYDKYREKDYTAVDRVRRWREKAKKEKGVTRNNVTKRVTDRSVTQAEAEAEAEAEKNTPSAPTPPSPWELAFGLELPEALRTENCLAAAKLWLRHKAETRTSYKPTGLSMTLAKWGKEFTPAEFPMAVHFSIQNGWKGVYRDRGGQQEFGATSQVAARDLQHRIENHPGNPQHVSYFEDSTPQAVKDDFKALKKQLRELTHAPAKPS